MDELQRLASGWAVRLTTFKRDGTPVGTPVSIVVRGYTTRHFELLPIREGSDSAAR